MISASTLLSQYLPTLTAWSQPRNMLPSNLLLLWKTENKITGKKYYGKCIE